MKALSFVFGLNLFMTMAVFAQEYNVVPSQEVQQAVEDEMGGPPVLYRQVMEQHQEYENAMDYVPRANPKSKTIALNMDQLDVPFEVEIAKGYITTLTFVDANGNPFPVRVSRVGSEKTFIVCAGTSKDCKIKKEDMDIAHILTIGTPNFVGRSNLRVFFKGLHKAIQIPLVVKKTSYHEEVTIMLPVSNPDAVSQINSYSSSNQNLKDSDDYYARALIDGIPISRIPRAVALDVEIENRIGEKVRSASVNAIFAEGKTYLKAKLRMPNPYPSAITNGFMNEVVYRFDQRTGVVTGFDENGQVVVIKLKLPDNVLGYREVNQKW
jgi:hypothetical protein